MIKRILRIAWVTCGLGFTAWLYLGFQASGVPPHTMQSNPKVTVAESNGGLDFRPTAPAASTGLIFLPGGMVEPVAYAPLLKHLAEAGFRAHLVYLPMRCACTASQTAELFARVQAIIASQPGIRWVLAGHSRGAMLASRFVHEQSPALAGLVLIGTTHPRDYSLAALTIPTTKIYGTRDGIASSAAMDRNKHLLPPNASWVRIDGGNHVQFGYYRHQIGDESATISREDQQRAVEAALLAILKR